MKISDISFSNLSKNYLLFAVVRSIFFSPVFQQQNVQISDSYN